MQHSLNLLVLAGGSGYLGHSLAQHFKAITRQIIILSRSSKESQGNIEFVQWDGQSAGAWQKYFCGADAVINLTGRSVNCRYTPANKQEIIDSRVNSTQVVGQTIAACDNPPPLWLNASSATVYADSVDQDRTEDSALQYNGFSEQVCKVWEEALNEAQTPQTRKVALRTSFVLGPPPCDSFAMFQNLAKKGLGGTMAGGRQYVSWIHQRDFCRAVEWIISHPDLRGPVNMTAPQPLPNKEFMRQLRQALHVPFGLPAARWMLEIGAFFMGTETELILKSRKVVPQKLLNSGFSFDFPTWLKSLEDIVGN